MEGCAASRSDGDSFFFQAEDGIRDLIVTGVQTCALPISIGSGAVSAAISVRPRTAPDPIGNYFRPVSRPLYYWLLARAGGESPLAFLVVNAALAALVVALLFLLVRRLAGTRAAALGSAFLVLHYALDVPVSWAAGAQDLLAVAGVLG